jgi:hypothetical protein
VLRNVANIRDVHVNSIVSAVNQIFYLLKLSRAEILISLELSVVFNALVLVKSVYASPAFSDHLKLNESNRIQSYLDKAFEWGFTIFEYNINEMFDLADNNFLKHS